MPGSRGWITINIRVAPRIDRDIALNIRSVPTRNLRWPLHERPKALISAWVGPGIQFVHVQSGPDPFDRLPGNRGPGAAKLAKDRRRDKADQQPQDGDDHKQFKQGEATVVRAGAV